MSDIYIVLDGEVIVGVSARLQGAELIRANEAVAQANEYCDRWAALKPNPEAAQRAAYGRMRIENHELQDAE